MLGKLIKHEFRATARTMLPLFGVVVLLAVFARLSVWLLDQEQGFVLDALSILVLGTFIISLVVVVVFAMVLMIRRFCSNLLSDEGYLMFTLPVNVHQLLWSKLIVSVVWFLATFLVDVLAVLVLAYEGGMVRELFTSIAQGFSGIEAKYRLHIGLYAAELAAMLVIGLLGSCLNFYAPISVGHAFANKKVLLSIVFYFANQTIWQTLGTIFGVPLMVSTFSDESFLAHMDTPEALLTTVHVIFCIGIVVALLQSTVMYIVSWQMLKKHRNLQ